MLNNSGLASSRMARLRSIIGLATIISGIWCSSGNGQEQGLKSGIELQHISRKISPGQDFFDYVNEGWLSTVEIPEDKSNYGTFTILDDETQDAVKVLIEESSENLEKASGPGKQVGALYRSYLDLETRNRLGSQPLQPILQKIEAIQSKEEWAKVAGELSRIGIGGIFAVGIEPDAKKSDEYAVYQFQGGTTLPDRDYYLKPDQRFVDTLSAFRRYIVEILGRFKHSDPEGAADAIIDLETKFAQAQLPKVELRDPIKNYNKHTSSEVRELWSGFNWNSYSAALGLAADQTIIVGQPDFCEKADRIFSDASLESLKDFLYFSAVDQYSPVLSAELESLHFGFHGTVLSGIGVQQPLWRRGVDLCNRRLGMPIGQLYVEKHFSPLAKARMEQLVENLKKAFELRIDKLEWMGNGTKAEAKKKLSKFRTKIGYPDRWKDYSSVVTHFDQLVGNLLALAEFEHRYELNKLGKPIDREEWGMTPQTINAYYNPLLNEICFPAAILQPPFFNLEADDAVNYGGIGAVIGHELSHGFDDSGSKFDGNGNLRDWWTAHDKQEFERRATLLAEQYEKYKPFNDMNVNGRFTLGENIGDLGGLAITYEAYQLSLNGKPAPVIDGLTGDQRFFLGWGQIWRRKYRELELRKRLQTDPHSPSRYRVIGIVSNMDEFYQAFSIKPDEPMYIAPENRVRIW